MKNYLVISAAIGFASGLRSAMGIAAFLHGRFAGTDRSQIALAASGVAVVGEAVMDKLPSTPSRLAPPGLIARVAAGAAGAYGVANRGGHDGIRAAIVGGTASLAGSYAGAAYRSSLPASIPPVAGALVEDAAAWGLTAVALNQAF